MASGIWEQIKSVMREPFEDNDEKIGHNISAMNITFKKLPFLGCYERALLYLSQDVCDIAAAELRAEDPDFGSKNWLFVDFSG